MKMTVRLNFPLTEVGYPPIIVNSALLSKIRYSNTLEVVQINNDVTPFVLFINEIIINI